MSQELLATETHVVNDLSANIDRDVGGRLEDRAEDRLRHEVGLGFGNSLGRSIRLSLSPRVEVDLGASLSRSESVLLRLGVVDDLRRDPDTRGGHQLRGRQYLGLGERLDIS